MQNIVRYTIIFRVYNLSEKHTAANFLINIVKFELLTMNDIQDYSHIIAMSSALHKYLIIIGPLIN